MLFDANIFEVINNLANRLKIIDGLLIFLANYLPYLMVIFLIILFCFPQKDKIKNRVMVLLALISAFIARFGVKSLIVIFYNRPRPYVNLPFAHKLISIRPIEDLHSFPSGHTIFFFALSTIIYSFNKNLGLIFFICSSLMGITRIFVGVHWPSDILWGAILGVIVGIIVKQIYFKNKVWIDNSIFKLNKNNSQEKK